MSFPTLRGRRRTTAGLSALACAAALLLSIVPAAAQSEDDPPPPAGQVTPADLVELDASLDAADAAVESAAEELLQVSGEMASVRIEIDEAAARADAARSALTDRIRQIYMAGKPGQVTQVLEGFRQTTGLTHVANAGVRSDQSLIAEVERESKALDVLRRKAAGHEARLKKNAEKLDALHERTVLLLQAAQVQYADDQAKLAALAARKLALEERRREIEAQQLLAAQQAAMPGPVVLDGVTPAVTARGQRAAAAEAPIIAALEAAGSAFPPGYRATGRNITGVASWYGPGFYGKPTATGAPYDAERFTCAMLAVPLGTVVRVTTADGRAINVLVNDRGPYIDGRVIDMSAIGARMLGYSGIKQVSVEVLEPLP